MPRPSEREKQRGLGAASSTPDCWTCSVTMEMAQHQAPSGISENAAHPGKTFESHPKGHEDLLNAGHAWGKGVR